MTAIRSGARDGRPTGQTSARGAWEGRAEREGERNCTGLVQRCARGARDVRFVRHRLADHRRVNVLVRSRSRFTFEKICALARALIGGNNEISDTYLPPLPVLPRD